jgi:peptide deformylase
LVRQIMRDPLFLVQKSVDVTETERQVVTDLLDTLKANLDRCVGMAANMIGVRKNIIVVAVGPFQFAMINPVITKKNNLRRCGHGKLFESGK